MSSNYKISPSYFASNREAAGFLNRRGNFTRALGADRSRESRFISADINPNRPHSAFRGVNFLNPSPFGTRPMKDFRGVVKNRFDGLTNPNTYVNDSAIDNRYQIDPQTPTFNRDNSREAEKTDYGNVEDWVHLRQHPEVGDLLANDDELRKEYFNEELNSDSDLQARNANFARQRLNFYSPLNDQYLDNNPDEAQLIGLNIGGTADTLNDNPEFAAGITEEPRSSYSNDIRNELASEVAAQFDPETNLDEEFFRENPGAAVYFHKHPGLVERLNQRPEDAKDFKRFYGAMRTQMRNETLVDAETALAGQGIFVDDYLSNNRELAVDVAVDERLKSGDSIADNTYRYDSLADKRTFTDEVYREHLSARAADSLGDGHTFDRDYFSQHPKLAYAVQSSEKLSSGLRNNRDDVNRFFANPAESPARRRNLYGAMHAFSSGYPLRESSMVDLWS